MARIDPNLLQLYELMKTDDNLTRFLREHPLLATPRPLGMTRSANPKPFFAYCSSGPFNRNKPTCGGVIVEVMKKGQPMFRCTACKNEKSAHHGPAAYNPDHQGGVTFFNSIDCLNRPNRKASPRDVLYLTFAIAHKIRLCKLSILTGSSFSKESIAAWSLYLRELCMRELASQPKMGGIGETVEIDETYLSGRRKYNRGRLMAGNRAGVHGNRRNNYRARASGSWLFGMVWRRTKEVRMVLVPDRSTATLIPIIKKHVVPGTLIISDEWRAYDSLPRNGYPRQTVNHSANFIDPLTGASTQVIERYWREVKLQILKLSPGVAPTTINSHLANFWWQTINGPTACFDPFLRYVELIANYARL